MLVASRLGVSRFEAGLLVASRPKDQTGSKRAGCWKAWEQRIKLPSVKCQHMCKLMVSFPFDGEYFQEVGLFIQKHPPSSLQSQSRGKADLKGECPLGPCCSQFVLLRVVQGGPKCRQLEGRLDAGQRYLLMKRKTLTGRKGRIQVDMGNILEHEDETWMN